MDDIQERLRETSENCLKSFEAWHGNRKNAPAREALQEAIHELRKVASRLEIELAISERNEATQRPIPIPPHRDAKRRAPENHDDGDDDHQPGNWDDTGPGNNQNQNHHGGGGGSNRQGGQRRRVQRRPQHSSQPKDS